ncbi:MAG TPA: PEGA domain-containing protein, partial [Candidatus Saccharimonadales bacterium]|nr:PEGA domain-containing protein [Candidatus Saccharimonadales bacterium]
MIDFSSKKVQLAIRFFTYGVMAVATVVLTILAIYYAMGYRLSQSGLVIEQGGIVEFRSEPSRASISVDGKPAGKQTPERAYVGPGDHTVQMQLDGYRPWQKQVTLQPGQLLWLDYVRFLPQTITTAPVREFTTLTRILPSPDSRWLLIQEQPQAHAFLLADVGQEVTFSPLVLPESAITKKDGKTGTLTLLEWSQDSRYILLRHENGDINEVLRLDRTKPDDAINVTKQFGLAISEVHFADTSGAAVYARAGQDLRRLDIAASTVSPSLVSGVKLFSVFQDRIAFVAVGQDGLQSVGVFQDNKETVLAQAPADAQVLVALTEYFRDEYVAYSFGNNKVTIVRNPVSTPQNFEFDASQPSWLQFSPKGRFVIAGNDEQFAGHDLEVSSGFSAPLFAAHPPQWLDPYHILTEANDQLWLHEFDGQNTTN